MAKYMLLSELEKYRRNNYLIVRSNRGAGQREFEEQCNIKEDCNGIDNDCARKADTH